MAGLLTLRRAARKVNLKVERLDGRLLLSASALPVVGPTYPGDSQFGQAWGLNNPRDVDIDAPEAWTVTTGKSSTIVAVIDSGIDLKSPEFAGRLWVNPSASRRGKPVYGWNFVKGNGDVQDDYGHGTHVTGVIAASANNGQGVVGVDWNARIMPLKALGADGTGTMENSIAAIYFAVDHGARVINASWATDVPDLALYNALVYADSKGVVFVTAAGNESTNIDGRPVYPAAYHLPNVIVVGAVDASGGLADFSNFGTQTVDVAAPGVSIYSTYPSRSKYGLLSGTSMAVPYVSGVVSLLVGLHPEWSAEQLVQRVLTTTKPMPGLAGKTATGGIVSAAQAVGVAGSGPNGDHYTGAPSVSPRVVARSAPNPRARASFSFRTPIRRTQVDASGQALDRPSIAFPRPLPKLSVAMPIGAWRTGLRAASLA